MEKINQIDRAIKIVGSLSTLSKLLNETPQVVSNWRARQVPLERCQDIERVTGGKVTCEKLRPDLKDHWSFFRSTKKKAA